MIYDGSGTSLLPGQPPFDGPAGALTGRPKCRLLFNPDSGADCPQFRITRIWCLRDATGPIDVAELCQIVAAIDAGDTIAVHGTDEDEIDTAIEIALALVGGGHA